MTQTSQKTYLPDEAKIERKCYLIDAKDKILGKVATKAANLIRGKHKAIFTPHLDTGDMVVVINAEKIKVTGNKLQDKMYKKYSGYPSGQKLSSLQEMLKKAPAKVIEMAVKRMIQSGPLGDRVTSKLKVYVGEKHPHAGQKPIAIEI